MQEYKAIAAGLQRVNHALEAENERLKKELEEAQALITEAYHRNCSYLRWATYLVYKPTKKALEVAYRNASDNLLRSVDAIIRENRR